VIPTSQPHLHQHWHQLCLETGTLHHLCKNVRVDTKYVGIIEEQKLQIKQLQEELAEFNHIQYRTLPANASRGKNVLRSSKKVSMTPTDHIYQQAVASYVQEATWLGNLLGIPPNFAIIPFPELLISGIFIRFLFFRL
jgi:hypothetical protein